MRKLTLTLALLCAFSVASAQTEIARKSGVFHLTVPLQVEDGVLTTFYGTITPNSDYTPCQIRGELWAVNVPRERTRVRQFIVKADSTYISCKDEPNRHVHGSFRIPVTSLGWIPEQRQITESDGRYSSGPDLTIVSTASYGYWQTWYEYPSMQRNKPSALPTPAR